MPPDLTKPISRRPRHITSAVAYSSATRTGLLWGMIGPSKAIVIRFRWAAMNAADPPDRGQCGPQRGLGEADHSRAVGVLERLEQRLELLGIAPDSLVSEGTVVELEEWCGLAFPESGSYVVDRRGGDRSLVAASLRPAPIPTTPWPMLNWHSLMRGQRKRSSRIILSGPNWPEKR